MVIDALIFDISFAKKVGKAETENHLRFHDWQIQNWDVKNSRLGNEIQLNWHWTRSITILITVTFMALCFKGRSFDKTSKMPWQMVCTELSRPSSIQEVGTTNTLRNKVPRKIYFKTAYFRREINKTSLKILFKIWPRKIGLFSHADSRLFEPYLCQPETIWVDLCRFEPIQVDISPKWWFIIKTIVISAACMAKFQTVCTHWRNN